MTAPKKDWLVEHLKSNAIQILLALLMAVGWYSNKNARDAVSDSNQLVLVGSVNALGAKVDKNSDTQNKVNDKINDKIDVLSTNVATLTAIINQKPRFIYVTQRKIDNHIATQTAQR